MVTGMLCALKVCFTFKSENAATQFYDPIVSKDRIKRKLLL